MTMDVKEQRGNEQMPSLAQNGLFIFCVAAAESEVLCERITER